MSFIISWTSICFQSMSQSHRMLNSQWSLLKLKKSLLVDFFALLPPLQRCQRKVCLVEQSPSHDCSLHYHSTDRSTFLDGTVFPWMDICRSQSCKQMLNHAPRHGMLMWAWTSSSGFRLSQSSLDQHHRCDFRKMNLQSHIVLHPHQLPWTSL